MEIGEFIEQDILIFLDDRIDSEKAPVRNTISSTLYLTRDYEKELTQAIAQNQPSVAKEILHALKDQFDAAPENTPDKEQLKALLTTLYERFKDFLDQQHIPAEAALMTPQVPEPDEPPKPPGVEAKPAPQPVEAVQPPKPSVPELPQLPPLPVAPPPKKIVPIPKQITPAPKPIAIPKPVILPKPEPPKPKKIIESASVTSALRRIDEALAKEEIAKAVAAYREAKQEATLHQQPLETLTKVSTAFGRIKQAIADRAKRELPALPVDPREEMDKQLLLQLEREKRTLDLALHRNSLHEAAQQYKRMRLLAQQISDPRASKVAASKLERIFAIINILRKHDDERRLKARP